jgi:hypothetical protein
MNGRPPILPGDRPIQRGNRPIRGPTEPEPWAGRKPAGEGTTVDSQGPQPPGQRWTPRSRWKRGTLRGRSPSGTGIPASGTLGGHHGRSDGGLPGEPRGRQARGRGGVPRPHGWVCRPHSARIGSRPAIGPGWAGWRRSRSPTPLPEWTRRPGPIRCPRTHLPAATDPDLRRYSHARVARGAPSCAAALGGQAP